MCIDVIIVSYIDNHIDFIIPNDEQSHDLFTIVCSETVLKRMVPNPVYDNASEAIYDEIPGETNSYLRRLPTPLDTVDEGYTSVSTTPEQVRTTQSKSRRQVRIK